MRFSSDPFSPSLSTLRNIPTMKGFVEEDARFTKIHMSFIYIEMQKNVLCLCVTSRHTFTEYNHKIFQNFLAEENRRYGDLRS